MVKQPWSWLYAVCFLDLLGASLIMPVFSTHLRSLDISHVNIGLLSSLYGASQLLSAPVIGSWSDVNGRRSILSLSMIICSVAYGLMGIVSSFYFFVIIRCVLGSFKHTQTLCRAFIADIVPTERQPSVHGLVNAFTSFSFMVGPTISGHIMEMENGFQYLTRTVLLIFILNASVVLMFANTGDSPKKNKFQSNGFYQKITLVFKELYSIEWKRFWALFCIKFLFALAGILFFQNMGVILTENFKSPPRYMGYTVSFYGFIAALSNLGVGKIKNLPFYPTTYLKSLTFNFCIMAVTFYLLYIVDNYTLFLVGLVPLSSSHALTRILMTEVLLEQSDKRCRGSMVGASSSVTAIARILTPFFSGLVITWGGVSGILIVSSLIAASACVLTVIYTCQAHDKPE